MGIRTDNQLARSNKALLRQQRVLNAHPSAIIEVFDAVLLREGPAGGAVPRRLNVLVGGKVVHDQHDFFWIELPAKTVGLHCLNGDRGGHIAAHDQIQPCVDQIACRNAFRAAVPGEDFLRHCHTHCTQLSLLSRGGINRFPRCASS